MSNIDGFLTTLDLLRSSSAIEIAKSIGSSDEPPLPPPTQDNEPPAPDAYAARNSAAQSKPENLVGLRLPVANLDTMDLESIQTLFRSVVTTNPALAQASIATAMAAHEAPNTLPGEAAARQGFSKDDAAQLNASALPASRLRDNPLPLGQQVSASGSRAELWEGWKPASLPALQNATNLAYSLAAGGLAAGTAMPAALIFNAAMLATLPYQRQFAAEFAANPEVSEEQVLNYLAALGVNDETLGKFRKAKTAIGRKLLVYLAMLLTALETVAQTMANELAALSGDERSVQESRERANSRGHRGVRRHVYVE